MAERAWVTVCIGGAPGEADCAALVEQLAHRGHVVFWLLLSEHWPQKAGSAVVSQISEIKRGVNIVSLASPAWSDVVAAVTRVYRGAGAIDALVCMTSSVCIAPFEETGVSPELELYSAATAMSVIKAVLAKMRRRGRGKIVFLSDVSSSLAFPGGAVHAAATCSLLAFGKALRLEVHHLGIDVTFITTNTFRQISLPVESKHIADYDVLRSWLHWVHSGRIKSSIVDADVFQKIVDHVGYEGRTLAYHHWIGVSWLNRAFVAVRSLVPGWVGDWLYSRLVQNPYGPFQARKPVATEL
ncbi:Dehydrogenase/reductase SDR family member 7C-A [Porphyridium purpureum]|uniref:Dehydrogenase/reductase SDR family member 7C-A n=1 Tax=Porphyridium purpureum TaxID=35688 RepID=A0A5J4Z7M7_PORPP|nr:Dehydrogenase/reductase SDR family member 7C-A [Porphyridium purpureum]|eukprot:POR6605..scf295_1